MDTWRILDVRGGPFDLLLQSRIEGIPVMHELFLIPPRPIVEGQGTSKLLALDKSGTSWILLARRERKAMLSR